MYNTSGITSQFFVFGTSMNPNSILNILMLNITENDT